MRHSYIDRYATLDSPLHELDARTKIVGLTGFIVAVLFIPATRAHILFGYFFLLAVMMGISQIPLQFILGRAFALLPFVLLAGLAAPWTNGSRSAAIGLLFARSILCLLALILLTNTIRFQELLRGLRRLGCPRILVLILGFLYRYLFVLAEEAMRMKLARDCRRARRAPVATEFRLLGSMLGTLLVRSFERAERTYQAMLSRGYSGQIHVYAASSFTWRDLAFLSALALVFLATFAL